MDYMHPLLGILRRTSQLLGRVPRTCLALTLIFGSIGTVSASPLLEEAFPWPNLPTMTFAFGGVDAGSGTRTFNYSNINPAEFDQLWWTPKFLGVGLSGVADLMTGSSLSAGVATYTGTTSWNDPGPGHVGIDSAVDTRIMVEIVSLSLTSVVPIEITTAAFSPGGFAIDVSGLTGFTAKFTAQAFNHNSNTWMGVNAFLQPQGSNQQAKNSVSGTFFRSAPSSVPEPATLALLGIGLAGLGFRLRKAR